MNISDILDINPEQIIQTDEILQEILKEDEELPNLKSGSFNFDKALGGGFYFSEMYLIFGSNKTGKTQLSHQLCVQSFKQYLTVEENKNKWIYYFDTENTFRPERLEEIASYLSVNYDLLLKKIIVSKIKNNSLEF